MALSKVPTTAAFVSQKGGVGKSTLARVLAIGAVHRGRKALLADFDLDQLTCVEWSAARLRASIEPEIDTRAFKSLKKLRKNETAVDFIGFVGKYNFRLLRQSSRYAHPLLLATAELVHPLECLID